MCVKCVVLQAVFFLDKTAVLSIEFFRQITRLCRAITAVERTGLCKMKLDNRRELKALVLNEGIDKKVSRACALSFKYGDRSHLEALESDLGLTLVRIAKNLNKAFYKRKNRVRDKVEGLFQTGEVLFLTLTFTDKVLASTSVETRRRYVARYLKSQCPIYVANIDFGRQNEREHYHALVVGKIDYKPWHRYGAVKGKRAGKTDGDCEALSRYVAKLSNHAMKDTANKGVRLIYSRGLNWRKAKSFPFF